MLLVVADTLSSIKKLVAAGQLTKLLLMITLSKIKRVGFLATVGTPVLSVLWTGREVLCSDPVLFGWSHGPLPPSREESRAW